MNDGVAALEGARELVDIESVGVRLPRDRADFKSFCAEIRHQAAADKARRPGDGAAWCLGGHDSSVKWRRSVRRRACRGQDADHTPMTAPWSLPCSNSGTETFSRRGMRPYSNFSIARDISAIWWRRIGSSEVRGLTIITPSTPVGPCFSSSWTSS